MASSPSRQIDHAFPSRIAWAVIAADRAELYSPEGVGLAEDERLIIERVLAWRESERDRRCAAVFVGERMERWLRNEQRRRKRRGGPRLRRGRHLERLTELDGALVTLGALSTAEATRLKGLLGIENQGVSLRAVQNRAGERAKRHEPPEKGDLSEEDEAFFEGGLEMGWRDHSL